MAGDNNDKQLLKSNIRILLVGWEVILTVVRTGKAVC